MRKFVWFESANKVKRSDSTYTFKVYEIKKNQLVYLCTGKQSYGMTRWSDSEVMNCLVENGFLPKSTLKNGDYYIDAIRDKKTFEISYIVPDNQ